MFRRARERFEAKTALIRQQALAAEIANFKQLRELLDHVHDETERKKLEKAISAGVIAMVDGRHPQVTAITIENSGAGADRA